MPLKIHVTLCPVCSQVVLISQLWMMEAEVGVSAKCSMNTLFQLKENTEDYFYNLLGG